MVGRAQRRGPGPLQDVAFSHQRSAFSQNNWRKERKEEQTIRKFRIIIPWRPLR
jgi:hypothetical protein